MRAAEIRAPYLQVVELGLGMAGFGFGVHLDNNGSLQAQYENQVIRITLNVRQLKCMLPTCRL